MRAGRDVLLLPFHLSLPPSMGASKEGRCESNGSNVCPGMHACHAVQFMPAHVLARDAWVEEPTPEVSHGVCNAANGRW